MNPESIYYLFEIGNRNKQEDYIWPVAGKATANDRVFIVCDGAGRFSSGEIASRLIGQFMATKILKFDEQEISAELIKELLIQARHRLNVYVWKNKLDNELATTFSMIILYNQRVLLSWCGSTPIYHLRGGEILFGTEDNSRNSVLARGIKADSSPIHAEIKWIEDVQDGDYFFLCSKGISESVTDDDIKLLVGRNDQAKIDLTGSFRRLVLEKRPSNYSMYLIRVKKGTQKGELNSGIISMRKQRGGMLSKVSILAMTIVGLSILVLYVAKTRTSRPPAEYKNHTAQPSDLLHEDSVHNTIVLSTPRKPIPTATDSKKTNNENTRIAPKNDNSAGSQAEIKPEQTNETPRSTKKWAEQQMVNLTTDESCKLEIKNLDLDEVILWDLSPKDYATFYLKPGKYLIVATSVNNSSKAKTYSFEVKRGSSRFTQDLHIKFFSTH
jgi:protein phosphatase